MMESQRILGNIEKKESCDSHLIEDQKSKEKVLKKRKHKSEKDHEEEKVPSNTV